MRCSWRMKRDRLRSSKDCTCGCCITMDWAITSSPTRSTNTSSFPESSFTKLARCSLLFAPDLVAAGFWGAGLAAGGASGCTGALVCGGSADGAGAWAAAGGSGALEGGAAAACGWAAMGSGFAAGAGLSPARRAFTRMISSLVGTEMGSPFKAPPRRLPISLRNCCSASRPARINSVMYVSIVKSPRRAASSKDSSSCAKFLIGSNPRKPAPPLKV